MGAENVDVGAGHSKMLASSWFSAPGEKPWAGPAPGASSVVEELKTAWVR
jgi:hypothetical protein